MVEIVKSPIMDTQDASRTIVEGVTWDEFLVRFADVRAEWLPGNRVLILMSNNDTHQTLLGFLYLVLKFFLDFTDLGDIRLAGMPMKVGGEDTPKREPDLIILLNEHRDRIKQTYIDGPADIAVEIVSPGSARDDRGDKFLEYEAAGVREYWLFDPLRKDAAIHALTDEGVYQRLPLDAQGRLTSPLLPGFALDAALLWHDPLPKGTELIALVQGMVGKS